MKPHFFVLLLLLVAVAAATGGVAAQDDPETNQTETECAETVNYRLAICGAELDGSDVLLDLRADGPQRVTVTEAFRRGSGELNRRTLDLQDGRNTVRLTVTVDGGSEGVTIDTGDVLYQKEVTTDSSIVAGPFTASDAQASGFGAAVSVALVTLYLVARKVYGQTEEPERIA